MYQDRLVVAVKHNGKVLRETKQPGSDLTDTVLVPYGAEYSLHIKNLNTVRALVRVQVDGEDATRGVSLIVPPSGSIDLERFLEAGQLDRGHRFKFIERTEKVEKGPRGVRAEDGLIRVEFEFERQPAVAQPYQWQPITPTYPTYPSHPSWTIWTSTSTTTYGGQPSPLRSSNYPGSTVRDVGITVPGSVSDQRFEMGASFATDGQTHVMVLRLLGEVGAVKVEKPLTVKTKQECPTCGTKNRFGSKFCRECGTGLSLLETVT